MLTPDVDEAIQWFHRTHDVEHELAGSRWALRRLPGPGALGQQDARLMQQLEVLRHVANEHLRTRPKRTADDELKTYHRRRARDD